MDRRASALELREPGAGQPAAEPEELATPHSYFDPYKPDAGAEADGPAAATASNGSPRPDTGAGDDRQQAVAAPAGPSSSPRVRIGLTATVVQFQDEAAPSSPPPPTPSTDAEANATAGEDQLVLPASPRDEQQHRNRFVISFQDVQSPEKAEGFKAQPPLAGRKKRALPSPARRVEEEGLGDDWASRPWKEPSVEAARTARRRALVSQGRLPLCSTDPDDLLFLGPGITLYFYFVRAIALFCLLASILQVPHLIISWSGGMLEPYSIGDATAGAFMAAGHMISYPGMETEGVRWCDLDFVDTIFAPNVPCTEPVIQLLGRRSTVYIKADHASYLVTACDTLTCLLFIATWLLLVRKHRSVQYAKDYATSVVSTKDYAVAVRGLPEDTREEEIVAHFNRLYALNGGDEDWTYPGSCCGLVNAKTYQRTSESIVDITGKVIGPDLQPVDEPLPAHDHPVYKRSWVVEAVVVHPMGSLIRRFKALEKLSQQLLYQRAVAKRVNANTTFKGGKGADPRQFEKAKQQLRATQDRIDDEQLRLKALAGDLIKMEKLCAGAYVIFEHRRSRDRALRDYEIYSNHLLPFVRPPAPLLFRGKHRLVVTEAPPPSDVIFENLEVSALSRAGRRVLTNFVTIVLLCLALFIVVSLRAASNNVAAGAHFDADLCGALNDKVYQNDNPVPAGVDPWFHFSPHSNEAASLCPAGSHFLSYFHPGVIDAAHAGQGGCLDPCFDPSDKAALRETQLCPNGQELQREALVKCYCMDQLGRATAMATSGGFASMSYEEMSAGGVVDLCQAPATDYFVAQVISALASVVTNIVNECIRFALPILVDWEKRSCLSESVTAFFAKTLLFLFLNTTGLLLLIHLRVENGVLNQLGFFMGNAADFDLSWYLLVGVALGNTMLINAFTMQLPFLAAELLLNPLKRRMQSTVANRVSQIHLNKAYAPSAFKIPIRLAMLVNTLIISLLFSSALPLLLPLALVAFTIAYVVDKFLLLRYSAKPPAYDGRLVRFSIDMMPWLLALHLLFAIVVYGHPDFFQSGAWLRLHEIKVKDQGETKTAYEALAETDADADVVGRVFLYSTLPLCILLAGLIVGKLLAFVWQDIMVILGFARRALSPYTQRCCARLDEEGVEVDDDDDDRRFEEGAWRRQERGGNGKAGTLAAWRRRKQRNRVNNFPPYTRRFEILYNDHSRVPDYPPDCGWEVELTPSIRTSQRMNVVRLVKRWLGDELSASTAPKNREAVALAAAGVTAEGGEPPVVYKKSWEVIKEGGGLHTYALEANPDYEAVMLVRATLHLSAKSLLGIETSRRLDWSRALESMRATRRGWSASEHDDSDNDDDDDEAETSVPQRRRRPQKVRARKAASRFVSLLLLANRSAEEAGQHSKDEGAKEPAVVADLA